MSRAEWALGILEGRVEKLEAQLKALVEASDAHAEAWDTAVNLEGCEGAEEACEAVDNAAYREVLERIKAKTLLGILPTDKEQG